MRRLSRCTVLGLALAGAAAAGLFPGVAAAQGGSGAACVVKGNYPVSRGVSIFDSATGGQPIAQFTGGYVPITASNFPASPASGRAEVATAGGEPTVRIKGFAPASLLPVFTAKDVPVAGSNVYLASGYRVRLVGASSSGLTVEHTVAGSNGQTLKATASCDHFSLERGNPTAISVGDSMRAYRMKADTIELFDKPEGGAALTLRMQPERHLLFWSDETQGNFVKVKLRTDIVVDAWARLSSLDLTPKGIPADKIIPPSSTVSAPQVLLASDGAETLRAPKEAQVYRRRSERDPSIGVVEPGAEVHVIQRIGAWLNVVPKSLGVMPPDGGGFWVRAKDLGR